jgi:hypothetical protein
LKIRDIIPHLVDLRFEILLPLLKLADPILYLRRRWRVVLLVILCKEVASACNQ